MIYSLEGYSFKLIITFIASKTYDEIKFIN
jgi:hypothetical protein